METRVSFQGVCRVIVGHGIVAMMIGVFLSGHSYADHLTKEQCYNYFTCVLGQNSALNRCYDNDFLKKVGTTRVQCMSMAQHECKIKAGISGKGKKLILTRPGDWYGRPTLQEGELKDNNQAIRIYNYAGWNHCPMRYQGLQDFWCDPMQLRYPPRPWCDVIPKYNVQLPDHIPVPDLPE